MSARGGGATIRVTSPLDGAALGEIPDLDAAAVGAAVARARSAQPAWEALGVVARAALLRELARRIRDDPELVPELSRESGKPTHEAEFIEVFYTLELTRFLTSRRGRAALAEQRGWPFVFRHKRTRVRWKPRGVVAVIGPWNWPLLNSYADCVAPLLAGNAVVLKPSELTPLTSLRVARLALAAGLPPGVLEVVTGAAAAGQALVAAADMVFLTGSSETGSVVAAAAGARLIPAVLELGGKSVMIVCADADLDRAAAAAVWSAFAHSGQVCVRTERIYVEAGVAPAFTEKVVEATRKLRHGPGNAGASCFDVGAMTAAGPIERAKLQIADAVARGARLLAGGQEGAPGRAGRWFEPTVIADVTAEMKIMSEETFGPLLPIQAVAGVEEAIALARSLPFGLSGSVWTADGARGRDIAGRLETGNVCVNDVLVHYFCVESPLAGIKRSGLGFRHSALSLRQFCRPETIVEDHPLLGSLTPWVSRNLGFPYQERVGRVLRWFMRNFY